MTELLDNTVYLFAKKVCPQCFPMRALVEQSLQGSTVLTLNELEAEEPNLELCADLGVDRTPAVVIKVNTELIGPLYEPVEVAEAIKHAKNIARRA